MDELPRDGRMRQLQRLAYGAVASDAERAAALAELEELRREREAARVTSAVEADASATEPNDAAVGPLVFAQPESTPDATARPLRWAIATGTAALLIGVAVGWQLAARTALLPDDQADQALGASASVSESISIGPAEVVSVPVTGSAAHAVFDRPASATDALPVEIPDDWVDPASVRLLATAPDGLAVYGAKSLDRPTPDVCVLIVRPNTAAAAAAVGASCTVKGVFEEGRLSADHYLQGEGLAMATWHADGSVQLRSGGISAPAQ